MEDIIQFEQWLSQMLKDSKEKLNVSDETIAYILLRVGIDYYLRTIVSHPYNKVLTHQD